MKGCSHIKGLAALAGALALGTALAACGSSSSSWLADQLASAGQVAVNLPTSGWDVHHPFGGFRDSGSAFKEQGAPGLRFYTRLKTAAVRFTW
jgi:acyl-CoA reductase-like NAD-dependent aldehyde dehydrogenase